MPNWCENYLTIRGSYEIRTKFLQQIDGFDLETLSFIKSIKLFDTFIPMPEEYNYDEQWYDWRVKNWGVKWDVTSFNKFKHKNLYTEIYFDTAWNPPLIFLQNVSKKYSNLSFHLICEDVSMAAEEDLYIINGKIHDHKPGEEK